MNFFSRSTLAKTTLIGGIILVGGLLSGCTKAGSPAPAPAGPDGITLKSDEGNVIIKTNNQGGVSVTGQDNGDNFTASSNALPADWPADLPTLPNASIIVTSSHEDNTKGTIEHNVSYTSTDSMNNLFGKLKSDLQTMGWKITDEINGGPSGAGFGTSALEGQKGGNKVTVTITDGLNSDAGKVTVVILGSYKK